MADNRLMHMQRILHLTLKRKWFEMVASGQKTEEYREIKGYWIKRLAADWVKSDDGSMQPIAPFEVIRFKNGYQKSAPTIDVECNGLEIGYGKYEWGAVGESFIIKLGKILSIKNYKNNNQ